MSDAEEFVRRAFGISGSVAHRATPKFGGLIEEVAERDRQKFEAGRQQGWRERAAASIRMVNKHIRPGVVGMCPSRPIVEDLLTLELPAAQPASEPAGGERDKFGNKPWHCAKCGKQMQFRDGICWDCNGGRDPGGQ